MFASAPIASGLRLALAKAAQATSKVNNRFIRVEKPNLINFNDHFPGCKCCNTCQCANCSSASSCAGSCKKQKPVETSSYLQESSLSLTQTEDNQLKWRGKPLCEIRYFVSENNECPTICDSATHTVLFKVTFTISCLLSF